METITYTKRSEKLEDVYLNNKHVGSIKLDDTQGYRYHPLKSKAKGAPFISMEACKRSLESE